MLNGYKIAMQLMIAASFVYMTWRLYHAIEQEKQAWSIKRARLSPQYTTEWADLPLAK